MLKVHFKLMAEGYCSTGGGKTSVTVAKFSMYPSDERIEKEMKKYLADKDGFNVIDFYVKKAYSLEDEV